MNKQVIQQDSEQIELVLVDKMEDLKSRLDQLIIKLTRSGKLKSMISKLPE